MVRRRPRQQPPTPEHVIPLELLPLIFVEPGVVQRAKQAELDAWFADHDVTSRRDQLDLIREAKTFHALTEPDPRVWLQEHADDQPEIF